MIKTIKNIKNTLIIWREYLQQKYQEKNTLQGFLREYLQQK